MNHKRYHRFNWLEDHPEDNEIDIENQKARATGYYDDDVRQLIAAICLRACVDYRKAAMGKKIDHITQDAVLKDCRRFFKSEMFQYFVNGMEVSEIERIIRATPPGAIENIWRKKELSQKEQPLL